MLGVYHALQLSLFINESHRVTAIMAVQGVHEALFLNMCVTAHDEKDHNA